MEHYQRLDPLMNRFAAIFEQWKDERDRELESAAENDDRSK
jgi:hypothetical protein